MVEGSLGKGLDALIKKSTPKKKKEKKEEKTKQETIIKEVKKPKQTNANNSLTINDEKIEQIKEEVGKNPRISLWSAKSAAVLRYLKKTTPEFSISNEASSILEEAIQNKYPEIWELFEEL